jgi:sulfopyruvate decarboxylase subunit alpha
MDDAGPKPAAPPPALHGEKILAAIRASKIDYVLSVPDLHTSLGLLKPIAGADDLKLIRVCKEDETLGIAAGLQYGDKRSLILIQYTGFLYASNAIRAVACEHKQPMIFMIGLLGKEAGVAPQDSKRFGVRIVEPILDVMGIKRILIETDADVPLIAPAIEEAYATSRPVAILIGGKPA